MDTFVLLLIAAIIGYVVYRNGIRRGSVGGFNAGVRRNRRRSSSRSHRRARR